MAIFWRKNTSHRGSRRLISQPRGLPISRDQPYHTLYPSGSVVGYLPSATPEQFRQNKPAQPPPSPDHAVLTAFPRPSPLLRRRNSLPWPSLALAHVVGAPQLIAAGFRGDLGRSARGFHLCSRSISFFFWLFEERARRDKGEGRGEALVGPSVSAVAFCFRWDLGRSGCFLPLEAWPLSRCI